MHKEFIKNSKGQRMAVVVEATKSQKGLAFVIHGLGGFVVSGKFRFENSYRK